MKHLGPLSNLGSRLFYVDLANQLDDGENLSSINLTCTGAGITISSTGIIGTDTTTKDGHLLEANRSVYFRAAYSGDKNMLMPVNITYATSSSNNDSTIVFLKVVPTII